MKNSLILFLYYFDIICEAFLKEVSLIAEKEVIYNLEKNNYDIKIIGLLVIFLFEDI